MAADTPMGPIAYALKLFQEDGVEFSIPIAHPLALLWTAINDCAPFQAFFAERLAAKPSTREEPWTVIIYTDEVTPGNPLAVANKRKFQGLYWSFKEFGPFALCREEGWMTCVATQSHRINKAAAGLSQMIGEVLKLFFAADGFDLQNGGVVLPIAGNPTRFWAKLGLVLQDGGAHKTTWHSRGDGASKLCLLCKNLFTASSLLADEDGTRLLRSNVIKWDGLVPSTNDDVRRAARFLASQRGTLSSAEFKELEQSLGVTYHPRALLLDATLDNIVRPVEVYVHDWMHGIFVDGVFNIVVFKYFEHAREQLGHDVYALVRGFIKLWTWPSRIQAGKLPELFAPERIASSKAKQHLKCQASELWSLFSVLALFVLTVLIPAGCSVAHSSAFLALCDVVELLATVAKGNVDPMLLRDTVHVFLKRYTDAWGFDELTPKCHWMLHYWDHLRRHGTLPNCFVLERKHRWGKRYAGEIANQRAADAGVIAEVTCHALSAMENPEAFNFNVGLINPRPASPHLLAALGLDRDANVQMAVESRFNQLGTCKHGDAVLIKDGASFGAGRVVWHCCVDDVPTTVISKWTLIAKNADHGFAEWEAPDGNLHAISTDAILDTVIFSRSEGRANTLLPWHYR